MRKHAPLIAAVAAVVATQVACTWFVVQALRDCWQQLIDISVDLDHLSDPANH